MRSRKVELRKLLIYQETRSLLGVSGSIKCKNDGSNKRY